MTEIDDKQVMVREPGAPLSRRLIGALGQLGSAGGRMETPPEADIGQ